MPTCLKGAIFAVLRDFDIDIFRISDSVHNYEFNFDNDFFQLFENSRVEQGQGKATVDLNKTSGFIKLNFHISGSVELTCDRSLDNFDFPIDTTNEIILKFGDEEKELTEEISMIPWNTQKINVAQYIYEFVDLSVPMKKLHPRYAEENESDTDLIYSTGNDPASESENNTTDPRWSSLKKLKK